ncbi:30S ribosomal protein S12 methylthiotransferase RimO [Bovifimicola ammoniilytica]|uniref:30S ribosomal protein S12 methylthiotransferase RimO n=1 Tax=Bovifimicola ammoniilytica TaxID=2981720 RepID=UPI0011CC26AC|nr:30S ribosomal protein S12 methylthiotransferase RimO [Bovifimicola ammoniilytica]MCU6752546.1 30S ribosomal protein S12 methylthiotransferase RimO [Bovifimicola ammoniilytica]
MKILFISLGCDKNLVDSEEMLGLLNREHFEFTDDESEADVIVINTCCFVNDAKEESVNTILQMAEYRKSGSCKALIVTGCLAQRYKTEISDEIPEVDAILGTSSYDKIVDAVKSTICGEKYEKFNPLDELIVEESERVVTTGGHYAYIKIAEGCNKCCTYCIIPKIRGRYRSVPEEDILKTAEKLVENGAKELILVAQETTLYGVDLYGRKMLPDLLKKICKIPGLIWVRILYCYPEEITDELIEVMKNEPKVCHYIDMPIQHASDKILKAMGRRTNRVELTERILKIRKEIPDIVLRTTLISGFPGETEEDHEEMLDFVDEMEFERLGVFAYSPEEDTAAAEMPDQIDEDIKIKRRNEIMELQQEIAFENAENMIGRDLLVMIEGKVVDENAYVGRTYMDCPNVDGNIFITTDEELITGDFVKVKVTGAAEYDLIGEII